MYITGGASSGTEFLLIVMFAKPTFPFCPVKVKDKVAVVGDSAVRVTADICWAVMLPLM